MEFFGLPLKPLTSIRKWEHKKDRELLSDKCQKQAKKVNCFNKQRKVALNRAYSAVMEHSKKSWVRTVRQFVTPFLRSQWRTTFWVRSEGRTRFPTSSRVRYFPGKKPVSERSVIPDQPDYDWAPP